MGPVSGIAMLGYPSSALRPEPHSCPTHTGPLMSEAPWPALSSAFCVQACPAPRPLPSTHSLKYTLGHHPPPLNKVHHSGQVPWDPLLSCSRDRLA